jgi:hypothetical protein
MKTSLRIALLCGLAAAVAPNAGWAQVVQERGGVSAGQGASSNIPEVERNPANAVGSDRDGRGGNPQPGGTQGSLGTGGQRPPAAAPAPSQGGGADQRDRSASGGSAPTR